MDKLVSIFKKIAKIATIIILIILSVLEFVALINGLTGNNTFMGVITLITQHLLLALLYGAPAVLLLVNKEKEGKITLSFLLGFLFISAVLNLIGYGPAINSNNKALTVIYAIVSFILGLAYAFVLICFLVDKVFGSKLMKFGFIVLVFSLVLIFILFVLEIVRAATNDWTFGMYLNNLTADIVVPLVMVFGLMLLDENK